MIKHLIRASSLMFVLLLLCMGCSSTKIDMNNYNGYAYHPAPEYYPKELGKMIGYEDGYRIYSLANDPDNLFLYPKTGLKLPRNLLAREDVVLPLPSSSPVEYIEIINKDGNAIVLDSETQNYIIGVFSGKYESILEETIFDSVFIIRISFMDYPQIFYEGSVYKIGLCYGLSMENSRTIALLDNERLYTWFDS